jgi:hypothetical protein
MPSLPASWKPIIPPIALLIMATISQEHIEIKILVHCKHIVNHTNIQKNTTLKDSRKRKHIKPTHAEMENFETDSILKHKDNDDWLPPCIKKI